MASTLPNNPSLDRLRVEARRLQRGIASGERQSVEAVRRHHPRPDTALGDAPDRFALHDAQLTVARRYGFTGWPALVRYLEIAAGLSVGLPVAPLTSVARLDGSATSHTAPASVAPDRSKRGLLTT